MFKVFDIDDCFDDYAMSDFLVGAVDEKDLIEHLPDIMKYERGGRKKDAKEIIRQKEWRIKEIEHVFTDIPYKVLECWGYME